MTSYHACDCRRCAGILEEIRDNVATLLGDNRMAQELACLRALLGWLPLSVREMVTRGDVEACAMERERRDEFIADLQRKAQGITQHQPKE